MATITRRFTREADRTGWEAARQRLGMFASLPDGWNEGKAIAPSPHTIQYAAELLAELAGHGMPAPVINPSADGAIYAHWNRLGIDVELIFEAPYEFIVLIDDARGILQSFEGKDEGLSQTYQALKEQSTRA